MKTNDPSDIFSYTDFRTYLKEWRLAKKKENSGFTHDYIASVLGTKNRSYFNDIEKGRRVVGDSMLDRLIKLLELKGDHAKYFRALVGFNQPSTHLQKEFWFEQLILLNHTPKKIVEKETYEFYKNWYHTTVRAFLDTCDFVDDYEFAAKRLLGRINAEQVKESIQLMSKLNLIYKNKQGFYKSTDKVVSTGDVAKGQLIKQYHISNLEILTEIIQKDDHGTHNSTQLTLSLSKKGWERVQNRINQLRSEIIAMTHKDEDPAEKVYKVAIHSYLESE